MPFFIKNCRELFRLKKEMAESMQLKEELYLSTVELKNCFRGYIRQLITYFPARREENIRLLREEMRHPEYDAFATLPPASEELSAAIIARDIERAYDIAERDKSAMRRHLVVKRITATLLRLLRI